MVRALGLELDSVWLSGGSFSELQQATRSATLLAFPLGRKAAAHIADKTGAAVVEADVPFGLQKTAEWLRAVGAATGKQTQAEQLIERELERATRKLEWAVAHFFLGRRVAFCGQPDLLGGFVQLAGELGMEVLELSSPALRPAWLEPESLLSPQSGSAPIALDFDEPAQLQMERWFQPGGRRPDLVIGNTELMQSLPSSVAGVELGFPSTTDHAYFDRPFLGFRGYLCFVQRMATAMGAAGLRKQRGGRE